VKIATALLLATIALAYGLRVYAEPSPTAHRVTCTRHEDGATITAHGWAFRVEGGNWITCLHVVERGEIRIGGELATIERSCKAHDVAVLRCGLKAGAFRLRSLGGSHAVHGLLISPVNNGDSGSPVIHAGEVVGMVCAYEPDTGKGRAVGAAVIQSVMERK